MTEPFDVAIIGGGIVGVAHAWRAASRGLRVLLLERDVAASGASVRNFGMIWPIGQPAGELYELALQSASMWNRLATEGAVEVETCGSIHLAYRHDELAVLEEFCQQKTHDAEMASADAICRRSARVNPDGLLGGIVSSSELRVDPRTAVKRLASWLSQSYPVECRFGVPVTRIDDSGVHAADGRVFQAERIIVCSGSDLQTLCPEILERSGLRPCKLQMLRTVSQPSSQESAPHLAGGLTLRHYASFARCPSLPALKDRIAEESPELDQFGIHVMASEFADGEIVLGDSHEYNDEISPFDKSKIDDLILRELQSMIRLDNWTIKERWHGVYVKHDQLPVFEATLDHGVHVFTGTGGAGMTMSFALAERAWQQWTGGTHR